MGIAARWNAPGHASPGLRTAADARVRSATDVGLRTTTDAGLWIAATDARLRTAADVGLRTTTTYVGPVTADAGLWHESPAAIAVWNARLRWPAQALWLVSERKRENGPAFGKLLALSQAGRFFKDA